MAKCSKCGNEKKDTCCKNARDRVYYAKNPDKHRKRNRSWRNNNPEKYKEKQRKNHAIREERLKNASGGKYDLSRPDYAARVVLYGFMCAYCEVNFAETLDHGKPVSRGGTNFASNIFPACTRCNLSKGKKILHKEWIPPKDLGFNVAATLGNYKVKLNSRH